MARRRPAKQQSRKEQLATLNRNLIRIGLIMVVGAAAYEFFLQPGFSLQRFLFLCAAAVLGLLVGRTIGRMVFLRRK